METNLIPSLNESLKINLPEGISMDELKEELAGKINHLVQSDFEKLVSLLYRVDVSEAKLKHLLQKNAGEDAGKIIAELIIERQMQKIKSRNQFKQRDDSISNDERW